MNTVYEQQADRQLKRGGGQAQTALEHGKRVGTAAALMVFCVFAMSLFAVLALGAGAYRGVVEKPRQGYEERACLSYVWTKVKNGDEAGRVSVRDFHGRPALWLDEEYEETLYHTVIYHHDGHVYELFFEAGYEYRPEEGDPIFRSGELVVEQLENGLIKVSVGGESAFISPRARGSSA